MDSFPSRLLLTFIFVLIIVLLKLAQNALENISEARLCKMADDGNKKAISLQKKLKVSQKLANSLKIMTIFLEMLSAALVSCTAVSISASYQLGKYAALAVLVSILILAAIVQLFGIYFPRKLSSGRPEKIIFALMGLINLTYTLCLPFEKLLYCISSLILKLFGISSHTDNEEDVTEEDIRFMVDVGSESGAIDPDEKEMIHNIFEFNDTPIKDIMTHRTDVDFLWKEDDIDTWEKTIVETNHSVYPVCGESADDIIGIVKVTDFYKLLRNDADPDVSKIIKSSSFVPESVKADDLFRQMQHKKNHFAVILDEYGGLAGIATMSDLLEEIVGDLDSDADNEEEKEIVRIDSNTWKILGSTDIDLVCEVLDIELPVEEFNTFAGLILSELGEIPENGTTVELEAYGLSIKVTKISEHRIDEALVCKIDTDTLSDSNK